ncbi:MAG: CopG family transcriptional regulator [Cyanobacteriota bacterium]
MPQKRPIRFTQRLDTSQFNQLERTANDFGLSKSEIIRAALAEYFDALDSTSHNNRTPAA